MSRGWTDQCEAIVKNTYPLRPDLGKEWRCNYASSIEVEGKWYCKRHDPRRLLSKTVSIKQNVKEALLALEETAKQSNDPLIAAAIQRIDEARQHNEKTEAQRRRRKS